MSNAVVPVVPFDDVSGVLEEIANSHYGQQVSLFGRNPAVIGPLVDEAIVEDKANNCE